MHDPTAREKNSAAWNILRKQNPTSRSPVSMFLHFISDVVIGFACDRNEIVRPEGPPKNNSATFVMTGK